MANKAQMNDQAAKGGLLGVFFYVANKYNLDPEIVLVLTPVIAALLASLSTKVGDPEFASFFSGKQETKSEN